MSKKSKEIAFADTRLESDYVRLASSRLGSDRRLYALLRNTRELLRQRYRLGKEIPREQIPSVYRRLFRVENLWSLTLPPYTAVLYSVVGNKILIVDML